MSKKTKQQPLAPRLRFPEFRDAPGWTLLPLQQLAERITTRNSNESTTRVLTNSAEHGVVDQRDYFDKDIATKGNLGSYYVVNQGDYVYNPRISAAAPVGPISRNNIDQGVMSPLYTVFRFNRSETDFYEHYFKSSSWHAYLRSVSSMGARHDRMSITNGDFMRMPVPDPHPKEQRKIAECLGSLDDLIAAEGRKLAALRDHKKALMQQLFPREGETRPRLRFPEFRDAEEWSARTIGEFADIKMCKRILAAQTNDCEGVPFYKIGTLGGIPDAYIPRELYEEYRERFSFPKKGDVLITCSGTIGKCVLYDGKDAYFQDSNIVWIANSQREVSNQFLHSVLLNVDWGRLNSTTITRIYLDDLRMLQIKVPPKKGEQQLISGCLSAIDALITAQAEKLDALRTHKRGLMQQLFPSPEGMQG
jgi:type I restriction enzyme S subunit